MARLLFQAVLTAMVMPLAMSAGDDFAWLKNETSRLLLGCQITAHDGAQWTRDFAYMLMGAGDLMDMAQAKAAIEYTLGGVRADGAFPDRVTAQGEAVYSPGDHWVDHADDNVPFGALLVTEYTRRTGDHAFFCRHEPLVRLGMLFLNRSSYGLVYNSPVSPNCTYGFTDTVAKTGNVLFTSILFYDASKRLGDLSAAAGCGNQSLYASFAAAIEASASKVLWDDAAGLFLAAEIDNRLPDVWGSAYAIDTGLATAAQAGRIVDALLAAAPGIFQRGQVRHLLAPQVWTRCITGGCPTPGTYQNGAFWATPHSWLLPALATNTTAGVPAALQLLNETVADFKANGTMECVNRAYHGVVDYVASATNTYAAYLRLKPFL